MLAQGPCSKGRERVAVGKLMTARHCTADRLYVAPSEQ